MIRRQTRAAVWLIGAAGLLAACATASAADQFLTVGGGYSPEGNQASLEKNVLYFQRVLEREGLAASPHTIFFADGTDPARDLQFDNAADPAGRLHRFLGDIIGPSRNVGYSYRSSAIPGVTGGANLASVDRFFNNDAWRIKAGDRFMLYFTGHGGKGPKSQPHNTILYLWNNQQLSVKDLTQRLDKLPAGVPVVLVMVQCYSGGFANVIFEGGDPRGDVDVRDRCGFFATVHDRMAAGCTPSVDEENYQEYSSYFWAALSGVDRTGNAIDKPDYDGDGKVSFTEAHAYALIHETSIDVSVKTSDAFLRRFSALKPPPRANGGAAKTAVLPSTPYPKLIALASPTDKAVLEQLCERLKLTGDDRAKAARQLAEKCNTERSRLEGESKKAAREYQAARRALADELKLRWPELASPWSPDVPKVLAAEGQKILQALERHRDFSRFLRLSRQADSLDAQAEDQDKQWARCQRVLRTLENVALEANLPGVADEELVHRYQRLLKSEAATLK